MGYMTDMAEPNNDRRKARARPRPLSEETAAAVDIYRRLRDLHRRLGGPPDGAAAAAGPLSIFFDPAGDEAAFARRIIDAFRAHGDDKSPCFEEGRVYCYNCESAACEHAQPPGNLSVFSGYNATGFPVWSDFFSILLERRDPRIDDLIDEPSEVVAVVQTPEELKAEQLRVFGRDSSLYDILGQVAAGYLLLPRGVAALRAAPGSAGGAIRAPSRAALTIQAVSCRSGRQRRLKLNVVGKAVARPAPGGAGASRDLVDVGDLLKLEPELELAGLLSKARKKLDEIGFRFRFERASRAGGDTGPRGAAAAVQPVLTRLARGIESIYRRRRRRTLHAAERSSERPAVGLALKDLQKAHPDRVLHDEIEQSFVVIGPKWRIHVFGRDGRHVTSLVLSRDGVRRRIDSRRWRYTTRAEMNEIRARAASLTASEARGLAENRGSPPGEAGEERTPGG